MSIISLNLVELGHFAAYLALAVALVQALAPAAARLAGVPALAWLSVRAAMLVFLLTSVGGLVLMHAFISGNFGAVCGAAFQHVVATFLQSHGAVGRA